MKNLKKLVEQKGLTVTKLAELCYSESYLAKTMYLYKLMNGKSRTIEIQLIIRLCDVLECTPNDLFL